MPPSFVHDVLSFHPGHMHWWRRQVEAAIAAEAPIDGASDLQRKLSHLHGLLRQPFVQLNHFSSFILLLMTGMLCWIVASALRFMTGDPEAHSDVSGGAAGSVLALSLFTGLFFAILFWPVCDPYWRSERCVLLCSSISTKASPKGA